MARGISSAFDVPKTTIDGVDLNQLWAEYQDTLTLANQRRTALSSLFTFDTTASADDVFQAGQGDDFEEASEFGEPTSLRNGDITAIKMGYPLKWYDKATRFTWKFLRDATAEQVNTVHAQALEADNRLLYKGIMTALFRNTNGTNENGVPVYSLWNGTDGQAPIDYLGNTFGTGHSHYLTSGSATLDATDVEDVIETVTEHGYGPALGDRIVVLANPQEVKVIAGFRAGVNGASFDFIPSESAPAYLTTEILVGERPPATYEGLKVAGSYGDALIVEDYLVPKGYIVSLASAGANSTRNPLAFREHVRPEYQGLRQIPGSNPAYPIAESYYSRGFGVGVRHRGAAAVLQVTASSTYTVPTLVF